jgi:hypothetical protein
MQATVAKGFQRDAQKTALGHEYFSTIAFSGEQSVVSPDEARTITQRKKAKL